MSILPLLQTVQAQLRSSIQISTLIDVVEELVRNSLDAAATTIEVEVDFSKGYCSVGDDGVGIPANEFREEGYLAQLGCTSKRDSQHAYGRRGCFLSDLSSLSLISISSRQDGAQSAGLVIGVLSGVLSRQQSVGKDDYLESHGTRVVVHNLFGNLPVRFKHFALRYAQPNEDRRAFHGLERRLVSYLLASARPVNIRLRSRNGNLMYTHRAAHSIDRTLASSFALEAIESIFKQAGLVPKSGGAAWKLASAQAGGISIRAAICLLPSPSKHDQFIAIGHQPLSDSGHLSCLYDAVNQLFDLSEFGALLDDESKTARLGARRIPEYRQAQLKHKMAKGVDRWPRFHIRIDVKSSTVVDEFCNAKADATPIPTPIMAVVELLKSLFTTFLQSQNLKPKTQRGQRNDISQSQPARSVRKFSAPSVFDGWKRVKHSAEYEDPGIKHRMPFNSEDEPSAPEIILGEDVRLLLGDMEIDSDASSPLDDRSYGLILPAPPGREELSEREDAIHWTDPRINKVMYVNACNSLVLPHSSSASSSYASDKEPSLKKMAKRLGHPQSNRSALTDRLKHWPTAVYQFTREQPIQSINLHNDVQCGRAEQFSEPATNLHIATKDLANATVLAQIDAKFILTVVRQDGDAPALLMVDQHAADERIKVEQLFLQLCAPEAVELAVPLNFEVTREEEDRLLELQDYFANWAIGFEIDRSKEMISVTHLPAMIAERSLHPSEPILSVGLSSGHVYTYRLPSIGNGDDTVNSVTKQIHEPIVNGHGCGAHEHELGPPPIISSIRRSSTASENGLGSIEVVWKTRRHKGSCRDLAFSHDGSVSYSAGTDGLVKAYDTATGKVTWKIALPEIDEDAPSSMYALSPQALLLGTDEGKVYVYDLREAAGTRPSHEWAPHGNEPVNGFCPLPVGENSTSGFPKLWVSVGGSTLAVTDIRKGVLHTSEDQEVELTGCLMVQGLKKGGTSVGEKLVVGQADGVVSLWERGVWGDLDERIVIDRTNEGVDSLCEVPEGFGKEKLRRIDERIIATGLASGQIRFARIGRNRVLYNWEIVHDELEGVTALGFDVGCRLVSGGGQTIKIWTEAKGGPGGGRHTVNGKRLLDSEDSEDDEDEEDDYYEEEDSESYEDEKPSKRKKRKGNKGKDRSGGIALTFSGVF
ncbi:hypothetical protein DV736_g3688, partial [Chaetothyriales sp. CBS 134916]